MMFSKHVIKNNKYYFYFDLIVFVKSPDTKFVFHQNLIVHHKIRAVKFFLKNKPLKITLKSFPHFHLLLLIEFPLWLPPSQCFSAHLLIFPSSIPALGYLSALQRSSEFPKSPRAWINHRERW